MSETKLLNQTAVLSLGFTKSMIQKLLPEPILKENPMYKNSPPMKLWEESAVQEAMRAEEFKKMSEAAEKRKLSSAKAVETKREKANIELEKTLKMIHVKVIDEESLEKRTLKAKETWYYNHCMDFDRTVDEQTLTRWKVNYIRHNLCKYERGLDSIYGKTGKNDLYEKLKKETLIKIAEAYPALADECKKQISYLGE